MSDEAVWKKIDELQSNQARLAEGLAVVKHEQEMQRAMISQQHADIIRNMESFRGELQTIRNDFHEARGGIRFGKWLGGIAVSIIGIGVAVMTYFKGVGQ